MKTLTVTIDISCPLNPDLSLYGGAMTPAEWVYAAEFLLAALPDLIDTMRDGFPPVQQDPQLFSAAARSARASYRELKLDTKSTVTLTPSVRE